MGMYINYTSKGDKLPDTGKFQALNRAGDIEEFFFAWPEKWEPNLVCIVNNGNFEAAAYADTPDEMRRFMRPDDDRPRIWCIVKDAAKLAR